MSSLDVYSSTFFQIMKNFTALDNKKQGQLTLTCDPCSLSDSLLINIVPSNSNIWEGQPTYCLCQFKLPLRVCQYSSIGKLNGMEGFQRLHGWFKQNEDITLFLKYKMEMEWGKKEGNAYPNDPACLHILLKSLSSPHSTFSPFCILAYLGWIFMLIFCLIIQIILILHLYVDL